MQAGKQRGALPLIRKFNEHSERLLRSAMLLTVLLRRVHVLNPLLTGLPTVPTSDADWVQEMRVTYVVPRTLTH